MWVTLQSNADWDCFETLILREIFKIQNPLLEEHCAFLEVIHLFPISWMFNKQTSVSYGSTESEVISLDAGLRLNGLPALELWDLITSVLGNMTQTTEKPERPVIVVKSQRYQKGNESAEYYWLCSLKRTVFASRSFVVCVWWHRSSDQDYHKKKTSRNETCFKGPKSCAWLVVRSNWRGPKKPNPVHRLHKPTRWHSNRRKFQTWWVESFVVLVQYQPFQFYGVFWHNDETISTRFRGRTSHSKIATNDESYCKDAVALIILEYSKSGETKLCKSKSLEFNC